MVGGKAEKVGWGKIVEVFKCDGKEFELYPISSGEITGKLGAEHVESNTVGSCI